MSAYCYICVLILLYMSPHTAICYLLYMCPHTAIYVSSYYYMLFATIGGSDLGSGVWSRAPATLYMCPHTTVYMCPHTLDASTGGSDLGPGVWSRAPRHPPRAGPRILTYPHVSSRMLTHAHIC